jgi:predicted MFS family arabinose efflux permease
VLLAMLAAVGNAPDFVVPVLAFITGLTLPVSWSGFTSFIPLLVEEDLLPHANAVEAASLNVGLIVGPALAGLLAALAGAPYALVGEIVLTLLALVMILRIPDLDRGGSHDAVPLKAAIGTGMRHIVREPVLRIVTLVGALNNVGWGVLMVVFPLWAVSDLGAKTSASGLIWSAFAFGSLVGALALSRFQTRYSQDAVVFVTMVVMGALMLTWTLASALVVALVLVWLAALVEGPMVAAVFSVRQQRTPMSLQAQVMGTLASSQIAAFAVGSAIGGPLIEATSPTTAILAVGTMVLLAGLTGAVVRRAAGASPAYRPSDA